MPRLLALLAQAERPCERRWLRGRRPRLIASPTSHRPARARELIAAREDQPELKHGRSTRMRNGRNKFGREVNVNDAPVVASYDATRYC